MLNRIINLIDDGKYDSLGVMIFDIRGKLICRSIYRTDEADIYYCSETHSVFISMLNDDVIIRIPLPHDDEEIIRVDDERDYYEFTINGNNFCLNF